MQSYEEFRSSLVSIDTRMPCPIKNTMEMLMGKWNMRVIFELTKVDSLRFGALQKQIGDITNTMLSNTLKTLEEKGIVVRTQYNEIPPHVEYKLSESGRKLYPIFVEITNWTNKYGHSWMRTLLDSTEHVENSNISYKF